MKQKLIFVLSLMAMAWSSAVYAAERVAPTLPTAQTPESGKSYWIYNVGAKMFIGPRKSSSTSTAIPSLDGVEIETQAYEEGFKLYSATQSGNYLQGYAGTTIGYGNNGIKFQVWSISSTEGGHTIQYSTNNPHYNNAAEYVGCNSSEIRGNYTEGNIVWQFFNPADAAHYAAEVKLYQALESTDGTALEGYWSLAQYDTLYANRATAAIADLTNAVKTINQAMAYNAGCTFPEWNDYLISFNSSGTWEISGPSNSYGYVNRFTKTLSDGKTSSLTATVNVDKPSHFIYSIERVYGGGILKVYVDGVEKRNLSAMYSNEADDKGRFCEPLSAGKHTITWEFVAANTSSDSYVYIQDIGCIASPLISVSLLEPGSLGTEVLYKTDHIKNVHSLKVKGKMNDDDWAKIKMMTELIELDLSEAVITAIPEDQFYQQDFLRKIILPEGIESVEENAFRASSLEETNFPSTLKSIGGSAYRSIKIKDIILPDGLESVGEYSFAYNDWLTSVDLGQLTYVSDYCFYDCINLKDVVMPNTLKTIRSYAFANNLDLLISTLPSSVRTIGESAFEDCDDIEKMTITSDTISIGAYAFLYSGGLDTLIIKSQSCDIGNRAFYDCYRLVYVELPSDVTYLEQEVFKYTSIETLKLNSATLVGYYNNSVVSGIEEVTLQVPSFLVNAYKLDSYWYNAKAIEGFDPGENDYYQIYNTLILNENERFGANTSLYLSGALKMNGSAAQSFDDITIQGGVGRMWCTGENIKATGDLVVRYYTSAKKWYFISLPFDVKVSDVEANGKQYAIRYYDGANRAANGASGSWKNYEADDIIPAGTGFIYQTNKGGTTTFHAYAEGANKQQIFSTREFVKPLALHASENSANRGWNLVGNPYQTYYNNHMLNFTAPITVWNESNRTYTAYSLTDDDYAIRPNEAFFVQCPGEEVQSISFPTTGKQLTNVIENQNAAKERMAQAQRNRLLIDLEVNSDGLVDKTRVVVNEGASLDYDMECDASKFMSTGTETPQIYTIGDEGTAYAINERPLVEGEVQLGFYTEKSGAFTISMPRCDAKKVYLVDKFENLTVDLSAQDYGFTAAEGKQEGRFVLMIESDEATGIESVGEQEAVTGNDVLYNVSGQRVGSDYKGIVIKNGKKVLVK
ncbi:MAG: leucine-rich repeat domain-containing protein [Bacteroidaceae bacterium]|nr:leucine-rich repeat domain-containing protein [Bacteroidaceae bacterium]